MKKLNGITKNNSEKRKKQCPIQTATDKFSLNAKYARGKLKTRAYPKNMLVKLTVEH